MILIISRDGDTTTDLVVDWLLKYSKPFLRVNDEIYDNIYINFDDFESSRICDVRIADIKVIWFRKNAFLFDDNEQNHILKKLDKSFLNFSRNETMAVKEYFFYKLYNIKRIKWLTCPFKMTENKLLQLGEAKKLGLSIPRTFLISSLKDLKNLDNTKEYITKPITNCIHPIINGESRLMKTSLVDFEKEGFELPDSFPTSLIQEKIEKSFELRIFYIDGVFYVTKIIEPKTSEIDHRVNIALQIEGMRYENYKLPVSIKTKLKKLLKKFELNCASIDMIVSLNGTYFFLEINPTGQFTYHSIFNNTYLEKKIADTLISFYYEK